jgi:hypothetical protein
VITVKAHQLVIVLGAGRWKYKTQDQFERECSTTRPYEAFSSEIVNATLTPPISKLSAEPTENYDDEGVNPFRWLDQSNISDIFTLIELLIVGIVIRIIVIV